MASVRPLGQRERADAGQRRSEEHTSELQSRQYLVCRLLLEKTKTTCNANSCVASRMVHSSYVLPFFSSSLSNLFILYVSEGNSSPLKKSGERRCPSSRSSLV